MTSTHDDYDQHAREYAAGLLRVEAERLQTYGAEQARLGMEWRAAKALEDLAALHVAADWLEAPR